MDEGREEMEGGREGEEGWMEGGKGEGGSIAHKFTIMLLQIQTTPDSLKRSGKISPIISSSLC